MKYLLCIVFLSLIIALAGCNRYLDNAEFVEKYENENFDEFKNTCIYFRSGNVDGTGGIYFASYYTADNGIYIIDINRRTNTVISTSTNLLRKRISKTDLKKLKKLTLKFITYPMPLMTVDSNGNVYISMMPNSPSGLARFSDLKYKTKKYNSWTHIKGNWYQETK
jgi:hypothetical protein